MVDLPWMRIGGEDATRRRGHGGSGWRLFLFWEGGSEVHSLQPTARLVIGRGEDCDLRLAHESVSRRHAVLSGDGAWHIEDLASSNGTFVDGVPVREGTRQIVEPGKVVMLGDVRLVLDGGVTPALSDANPGSLEQPMERVARLVDVVADSPLPVFLLGETGVGKGRLAEEIHRRSARRDAPFVRLNCAALPESLLESELFGHERGAFTGAVQAKAGILESANHGTVFLDEIGEVSRPVQAKLLHVLEHDEVLRLGAVRPNAIDVRFIAATNREIEALVAEGQFRRDLYFRLAGVPLRIPPLRERKSEIADIARAFVDEASARAQRPAPRLSPAATARLVEYGWPGNIRELRNVVLRAVVFCKDGPILPEHMALDSGGQLPIAERAPAAVAPSSSRTVLPPPAPPSTPPETSKSLQSELRSFERQCLMETLDRFGGHQGKTAEHLGISRRTLTNKLNELELPRPRKGRHEKKP